MAANGQLPPDWDVASLFKLLQTYGDSTTASALGQFAAPYKYYAAMALAGMEDGEGLQAHKYPDAGSALKMTVS